MFDVAVVGGGIAGKFSAYILGRAGLNVVVIEEDDEFLNPSHCTGVVGTNIFSEFSIPSNSIRNKLYSATFFSPSGKRFRVSRDEVQAYVLDRRILEQDIYHMTELNNVRYMLCAKCFDIKIRKDCVELYIYMDGNEDVIHSQFVILATGINYDLLKKAGLKPPPEHVSCAQVEADSSGFSEVEIYVGNRIAPGSFAWIVPVSSSRVRIGMSAYANAASYLKSFLSLGQIKERLRGLVSEIRVRPVPLGVAERTYGERMLIVGDCAGQIKPMTFGGIYFSLICSSIAAETILEGFRRDDLSMDFIARYEERWKDRLLMEIKYGLIMRKLLSKLPDEGIESIFDVFSHEKIRGIIDKYADFDMHRRVIIEILKTKEFWRMLAGWLTM